MLAEILWEILVEDVSQTWEPCRLMGLNEPNIIRRSNLQRWADRNIHIPQSQIHTFYKVFNELISTNKPVLLETPETFFLNSFTLEIPSEKADLPSFQQGLDLHRAELHMGNLEV